jgi:predicted DCC family thiol-disulfide oxidoreductase YuxK
MTNHTTDDVTNLSHACTDILFFDGQCPLCTKEIEWLQKYQCGTLSFQDIHTLTNDEYRPSKETMLQSLHLLINGKEWVRGLDATARAWSHTPYGFIVRPLRWYIIRGIADSIYQRWANKRYQKRKYCSACISTDKGCRYVKP